MLAYVFWHTAQPAVDPADYESRLGAFHTALADAKPDGLIESVAFRMDSVPWLESDNPVYEDWYLLEGSAALDPLNDAAVSAHRSLPHDAVASVAGAGCGGLYRLRLGTPDHAATNVAFWVSKPPVMKYPEFYETVEPAVDSAHGALWGRQMVLGPAPEFCIHAANNVDLPRVTSRKVVVSAVWPVR
jgi:hypothetical protein